MTTLTLGQRMAILMKQKQISNLEMAEHVGLSPSYIAKMKTDQRTPHADALTKIASKLCVSVDYLLGKGDNNIPFYPDLLKNDFQGINLMTGVSLKSHFAVQCKWTTVANLTKDDILVFKSIDNEIPNSTTDKIFIVAYDNKEVIIGRINKTTLYFDNGLAPVDISDRSKYTIKGKLVRAVKYFN